MRRCFTPLELAPVSAAGCVLLRFVAYSHSCSCSGQKALVDRPAPRHVAASSRDSYRQLRVPASHCSRLLALLPHACRPLEPAVTSHPSFRVVTPPHQDASARCRAGAAELAPRQVWGYKHGVYWRESAAGKKRRGSESTVITSQPERRPKLNL